MGMHPRLCVAAPPELTQAPISQYGRARGDEVDGSWPVCPRASARGRVGADHQSVADAPVA